MVFLVWEWCFRMMVMMMSLSTSASISIMQKRRLLQRLAMGCMSGTRRMMRRTVWKNTDMIPMARKNAIPRNLITRTSILVN